MPVRKGRNTAAERAAKRRKLFAELRKTLTPRERALVASGSHEVVIPHEGQRPIRRAHVTPARPARKMKKTKPKPIKLKKVAAKKRPIKRKVAAKKRR